jgi:hypothetical protein
MRRFRLTESIYRQKRGPPSGGRRLWGKSAMQSAQPENTDPMPLRRSTHGVGTLMLRFVGLLVASVVLMALLWSR